MRQIIVEWKPVVKEAARLMGAGKRKRRGQGGREGVGEQETEIQRTRNGLGTRYTFREHTPSDLIPPTQLHSLTIYLAMNSSMNLVSFLWFDYEMSPTAVLNALSPAGGSISRSSGNFRR
jgi:hypothetical protein